MPIILDGQNASVEALARNTTGAELVVDGGNTIQLYPIIPKE